MRGKQFWIQVSSDTNTPGVIRFKAILCRNRMTLWQLNCDVRPEQIPGDKKEYLLETTKMWYDQWQKEFKKYLPKTTAVSALPITIELNTQKGILKITGNEHDPSELAKQMFPR